MSRSWPGAGLRASDRSVAAIAGAVSGGAGPGGAGPDGADPSEVDPDGAAPGRRGEGGFTLIEVLAALAVLSLLLLALGQGLRLGLVAWSGQLRMLSGRGDEDAAQRAVRRLVEQMDPGGFSSPPQFVGAPDRASFVTLLPAAASLPQGPRIDAALALDRAGRLVLRWSPHRHGIALAPASPPAEEVLATGVSRIAWSYLDGQNQWRTSWRAPELPRLLRLHLEFKGRGAPHWPDLLARPRTERPLQ